MNGGGVFISHGSAFFFFPAGSATSWVCQNLFRRSFIVFISLFVLPNRRSWIMKLMNQKGLLCLKWHQSCTKTARYHFFLLSGFLWAGALDFPGPIFLWTMLLLQQTWTFWHKWKWNTKRCPAGAAARRRLGVSRSFRCRLKIIFGSSRTSCKCQVCKEIL